LVSVFAAGMTSGGAATLSEIPTTNEKVKSNPIAALRMNAPNIER